MLWSGAPASGKISDLSLGGCLIETDFPFAPGTLAEISLVINGVPIQATTQVRHLYGHSGVGLEFTRLTRRSLTALDELVRELATRQEIVTPGTQLATPHIAGTVEK